ncbi:uncharacterized protein ACB058_003624 isoform 3-T3 [Synchiropus picturatus]
MEALQSEPQCGEGDIEFESILSTLHKMFGDRTSSSFDRPDLGVASQPPLEGSQGAGLEQQHVSPHLPMSPRAPLEQQYPMMGASHVYHPAVPHTLMPVRVHRQPGPYMQNQPQQYHWPRQGFTIVEDFSHPPGHQTAHHGHMMDPPENMNPLGVFHSCGGGKQPVCVCRDSQGRVIQLDVAPSCSATAPDKVTSKQQQDKPYVKKPPNAFVIFMRENRAKIKDFAQPKHSAEANAILGQMWKTMSPQDQEKYYQKAAEERRLHAEQHPDWSSKDNYGKKRKRQRSRAQTK